MPRPLNPLNSSIAIYSLEVCTIFSPFVLKKHMLRFAQIISVFRTGWRFACVCVGTPYMWTLPDGHEGDLVFISGRLKSASGRLFDSIFNASFRLFSVKLERNFKQYMNYSAFCFKFTLKLTKISTKYIKTDFSVIRLASLYFVSIFSFHHLW